MNFPEFVEEVELEAARQGIDLEALPLVSIDVIDVEVRRDGLLIQSSLK